MQSHLGILRKSSILFPLLGLFLAGALIVFAQTTTGPSAFCHETDGVFTSCADGNEEWSDITGTSFFDVFNNPLSVLYVDQADKDPSKSIPDGSGIDTLMLMYDEVLRTVPLGPSESVHVHFMTVDELELLHYDVFIGSSGIAKVLINDVEQVPMPSGVAGVAGFGTSPNSGVPHVMAEFQIGLEAAGFTSEECCYSPDPAWWGSDVPANPLPGCARDGNITGNQCPPPCEGDQDCDGIPDGEDQCPLEPGLPENQGCPKPGEPVSTSAAVFTANLDGSTTVESQPLLPPGTEPSLCESIGRIVDFRVPPNGTYKNHGDYMRKVAQAAEALVNSQVTAGLITPQEGEELQSCLVNPRARSNIGKK